MLLTIVKEYRKLISIDDERLFQVNVNLQDSEVSFYHLMFEDHLPCYKKIINSANKAILTYVNKNYFYKVIRYRDRINYFTADDAVMYINRIQIVPVEKSPKTSHLAQIGTDIRELYV